MTTPLLGPDGRPAQRQREDGDDRCPRCRAGQDRRVNTAGFGPPQIHCDNCGHYFEGETE
jgi:hypothetical protein